MAFDIQKPDCAIDISVDDFEKLHENPQVYGQQLLLAGKVKITGNQLLAMKLGKLFAIGAG